MVLVFYLDLWQVRALKLCIKRGNVLRLDGFPSLHQWRNLLLEFRDGICGLSSRRDIRFLKHPEQCIEPRAHSTQCWRLSTRARTPRLSSSQSLQFLVETIHRGQHVTLRLALQVFELFADPRELVRRRD